MAPKLSTVVECLLFSVPLYFLVGAPLYRSFFGDTPKAADEPISYEKSDLLVYPDPNLECPPHTYTTHILSRDPLVIYIPNFISDEEASHMVELSEPLFKPATIHNGQQETLDLSIRNSSKAPLPRDHTVQCVEARARAFQGWRPDTFIEKLWAQRYGPGGHYVHHYDWSTLGRDGAGRLSSFMAYLEADCTGGGTNFPRLKLPAEPGWCEFVECDGDLDGVTFKPVKGNAVYWENFSPDGAGYEETWHAGLPVKSGTKVGLNIWSWRQPGHRPRVEEMDHGRQAESEA